MTEIPKDAGQKVIAEWRDAADRLSAMSPEQVHTALNLEASYRERLDLEVASHRADIANMLRDLADECSRFYEREEWRLMPNQPLQP